MSGASRSREQGRFTIRRIEPADDAQLAVVLRTVLAEWGLTGPGSAWADPEIDAMSQAYSVPGAAFFVVAESDRVLGGAGYLPLLPGDRQRCELRKMYFLPEIRGLGLAARLLALCIDEARHAGYTSMHLETLARMHAARRLYESFGFEPSREAKSGWGHAVCDAQYVLPLRAG